MRRTSIVATAPGSLPFFARASFVAFAAGFALSFEAGLSDVALAGEGFAGTGFVDTCFTPAGFATANFPAVAACVNYFYRVNLSFTLAAILPPSPATGPRVHEERSQHLAACRVCA